MSTLKVNNVQDLGADAVVTNGVIDSAALPTGSILQVVSTTKTDTFSTTSGTPVDITGATVTITPSSATSKIFISFSTVVATSTGDSKGFQLLRDSTVIGGGTAVGSRLSAITVVGTDGTGTKYPGSATFLDSPATTSSITYSLKVFSDVAGRTTYIGRSNADGDDATANNSRTPLTITAMEVAG